MVHALTLLTGPEEYFRVRGRQRVLQEFAGAHPSGEVTRFSALTYQPNHLQMVASPTLFAEEQLIVISDLSQLDQQLQNDLLAYLDDPFDHVFLLLEHEGGQRGKKLLDRVRKGGGTVVECKELKKPQERLDFVRKLAHEHGVKVQSDAAEALVDAFGSNLNELAGITEQLALDGGGNISKALVEQYFGGRQESTGFAVADAALRGDVAAALTALRHCFISGLDPVPVVAVIALKARNLIKAASGKPANQLGMAPWQLNRAKQDLRIWNAARLAQVVTLVADADEQVKGAGRDPQYAVESLVLNICRLARAR